MKKRSLSRIKPEERDMIFDDAKRLQRKFRGTGTNPHQISLDLAEKYGTSVHSMSKFLLNRGIECRHERTKTAPTDLEVSPMVRYHPAAHSVPIRPKRHLFELAVEKLAAQGVNARFRPNGKCYLDGVEVSGFTIVQMAGIEVRQ